MLTADASIVKNGLVRYNSRKLLSRAPEPVRDQLRHLILAEIDRGTFLHGTKLPSERELADKFGTSRTTVRQAIELLVEAGTLVRSAGKGTFVAGASSLNQRSVVAPVSGPNGLIQGTLAFVISEDIFEFVQVGYNRILLSVQKSCQQSGYRLLFPVLTEDAPSVESGVAGCMIVGGAPRRFLERLRADGTPVVLVDLLLNDHSASVGIDYAEGMRQAVTYLHSLGHCDIGFIGFPNSEKYIAYWQTLSALGMRYDPRWVVFLQFPDLQSSMLAGYRAMQSILAVESLPTAMLATNDLVALGAKDALAVAGIEVPSQMSVMGFDDLGTDAGRPLTTMRTDSAEVGRLAVGALLEQIRGEAPEQQRITVPTELVVRESTAPVCRREEGKEL
jgi:LacI family transcriptional regulator